MNFIENFIKKSSSFFNQEYDELANQIANKILFNKSRGGYTYIAANGGSYGNISHVSNDLIKNGNVDARILSDVSTITCLSNDYGYENIHVEYLKRFTSLPSLIIICSVSGESNNLVNLLKFANENLIETLVLTGFAPKKNKLLSNSNFTNIEVPSHNYNDVELMHMIFLLGIVENVIENKNNY